MTNIEKIEVLKDNMEFLQQMNTATTAEDIQEIFAKYDMDFTIEEAKLMLEKSKDGNDAELSAEDLDNVTGGYIGFVIAIAILIIAMYIYIQRERSKR